MLALVQLAACTSKLPEPVDSGASLYKEHCAACHGARARGDGPVAPIIGVAVPDLTRIAARRDGRFPDDEIFRIIDGQAPPGSAHRDRMPVWGYELFGSDPDDEVAHRQAAQKIERLVAYLRSLQSPESGGSP